MVFFVCEGCNESLKKNQVDKHAMKCHGCWAVTCVDCSVTFPGNDYAAHTSCVSEAQKYEGSLYKGKKEKMNAQDKWAVVLEYAFEHASEAPASIRSYVPAICQSANVPRQQKKFINFAKNSVRLHSPPLLEELWNFLESMKAKAMPEVPQAEVTPTPVAAVVPEPEKQEEVSVEDKEKKSKKKKKSKSKTEDVEIEEVSSEKEKDKKKSKKKKDKEDKDVKKESIVAEVTEDDKKDKKSKKKKRKLENEADDSVAKKAK